MKRIFTAILVVAFFADTSNVLGEEQIITLDNEVHILGHNYIDNTDLELVRQTLESKVKHLADKNNKTAVILEVINHLQTDGSRPYLEYRFKLLEKGSVVSRELTNYQSSSILSKNSYHKYERLKQAHKLWKEGVLTDREYNAEKHLILDTATHVNNGGVKMKQQTTNKRPSKCEAISQRYNSLLDAADINYCYGHSVSFDYYTDLDKQDCGDFKRLIEISREGFESACSGGNKQYPPGK